MTSCTKCGCDWTPLMRHSSLCAACLLRIALERTPMESEGVASAAERLTPIGQGPNGIVYLGRLPDDSERLVTLKVIQRPVDVDAFVGLIRQLIVRLHDMEHARISCLLDADATSDGGAVVCAEYAPGCQIDHFFHARASPRERLEVLVDLCNMVAALHAAAMVHGSIKPQNVIVAGSSSGAIATLLDTGIGPGIEACSLGTAKAARAGQRNELFDPTAIERDICDLQRLVLQVLHEAGATVCAQLRERLQSSRCSSAGEIGAELHATALTLHV